MLPVHNDGNSLVDEGALSLSKGSGTIPVYLEGGVCSDIPSFCVITADGGGGESERTGSLLSIKCS